MRHCLLFLVLVSLVQSTITLLPVLIYPSKRTDSTETSFTKFKSPPSTIFNDLSFCFWVKVNHLVGTKIIHYELNDTKGFGFTLQEEYGFLNLKVVDLLFDYHTPHIPDRWRHFCTVYDSAVEGVTVYMDGQVTFEKIGVTALAGTEFHKNLLEHVSIGKGGGSFSQQFNGEFSQLMVWGRALGREEVEWEWLCEGVDTEGLVLDWRKMEMDRGDTVMMVNMEVNCPSQLGEETEKVVGFGQRLKFEEAETVCLGLGGRQEPPEQEEEVVQISERFGNFMEDCHNKFWVPIEQEDARWISLSSSSLVPYLPWTPGQPNGGRHQACVEAKFDKLNGSFQGYNDLNCAKSIRCFFCKLNTLQKFSLRGMCKEAITDTKFVMSVDMQNSNRPHWKGYRTTEIFFSSSSSSWLLIDTSLEKMVAMYNASSSWPVGRHVWNIPPGVCGSQGGRRELLLSSCSSSEFSCGDGTCLPLSSKCDGMSDCKDELDERDCRVVEFPTQKQYKEVLPPVERKAGGGIIPTKVTVGVDVMSITEIMESAMTWGCKLQLSLTWVEGRVRWRDLRDKTNLNIISQVGSGQDTGGQNWPAAHPSKPNIWVPVVIFTNTPHSDFSQTDAKSSITVMKVTNYTKSPMDQLEEVTYYEGRENPVTYRRKFKKQLSCNFHLHFYPFDTQSCSLLLDPPAHASGLVKLRADKLVYSGPVQMLQYNIINWEMEEVGGGLKIVFKLQRRIHHHLFTTFIPTFCLMIVCQSTLYFKAEHFKTTAGVTVTTMLVMYTLYQSVSHKLVPTAYIKIIDVWLIFGLILPFCVFFLLVMIDHLPSLRQGDMAHSRLSMVRELMVKIAHYLLPMAIILFAASYTVAAATIYNYA